MRAGVTRKDRLSSVFRKSVGKFRVVQYGVQVGTHFNAIAGHKKVLSFGEKMFAIVPRGADQRDAAGQRFKRPDRGNAAQRFGVRAAWDMHRNPVAGKHAGRSALGSQRRIFDAVRLKQRQRMLRVTHAIHAGFQTQRRHRLDQVFL